MCFDECILLLAPMTTYYTAASPYGKFMVLVCRCCHVLGFLIHCQVISITMPMLRFAFMLGRVFVILKTSCNERSPQHLPTQAGKQEGKLKRGSLGWQPVQNFFLRDGNPCCAVPTEEEGF